MEYALFHARVGGPWWEGGRGWPRGSGASEGAVSQAVCVAPREGRRGVTWRHVTDIGGLAAAPPEQCAPSPRSSSPQPLLIPSLDELPRQRGQPPYVTS